MNMQRMNVDDVQKAMKLLSLQISEQRLQVVTPALNQTLEALQQLTKLELPKDLEPTTFLTELKTAERERPENI